MLRNTSFLLMVATILVMMAATLIEKQTGTATAIYGSWWFASLWTLLVVSALTYCLRRKLQRRPATFLLHISFVVILAGALITHIWGKQGTVHLRIEHPTSEFITDDHYVHQLPFLLQLREFKVEYYPGTQSPMDYVSRVECGSHPSDFSTLSNSSNSSNPSNSSSISISMNHIGEYQHYRFYQSGYDPDMQGTLLAVSYDPWGIGVTYVGYGLLFLSMLLMMMVPNEGMRRAIRVLKMPNDNRSARVLLLCLALLVPHTSLLFSLSSFFTPHSSLLTPNYATAAAATPKTLPAAQASEFCDLHVYYNGRICPLQTVAKDFTLKLYGKQSYEGMNFEQVFCGFIFYPTTWLDAPIIKVKGEAALVLGIEGKYATYQDFFDGNQYKLEEHLYDNKRALLEADEKANILKMLWAGELLKFYPYQGQWLSQGDDLPMDMPQEEYFFIKKSMDYVGELVVTKQYDKLTETLAKIRRYQEKQTSVTAPDGTITASTLPSTMAFHAEKIYNRADYTKPLAMAFATLGIVLFLLFVLRSVPKAESKASESTSNHLPIWLAPACNAVLVLTALYLLFLLGLRTYVSGHLPLSNGFETMQFMALCVVVITLLMQRRFALAIPFGFLLIGLTLLVSMMGEANPQITLLMPVLQSPLLSLHVCVIMIAYSLLAFTFLNGIAYFVLNKLTKQQINKTTKQQNNVSTCYQLTTISRLMLYPALFCMAAGIFIGAIWANVSWGRYWGWDPKEVWALITMLVYSFAMHGESLPFMRKPLNFHLFMILAFLTVLMTYFGVNFLLGGMHSYANS